MPHSLAWAQSLQVRHGPMAYSRNPGFHGEADEGPRSYGSRRPRAHGDICGRRHRARSCAPGETVTVAVIFGDGTVRVEVTDRAGPGTPELRPADRDAEGGRGLQLVAGLAARWGWRRRGGRMVTWFELSHPC